MPQQKGEMFCSGSRLQVTAHHGREVKGAGVEMTAHIAQADRKRRVTEAHCLSSPILHVHSHEPQLGNGAMHSGQGFTLQLMN